MSTLEKTIHLLYTLPENEIENIYSYVQFLTTQQKEEKALEKEPVDEILGNIIGAVHDRGKTLEEYRQERIAEKYETAN